MHSTLSALAIAAVATALPAAAQPPVDPSRWYLGAAIGLSKTDSTLVADREAAIGGGNEPNMQTTSDLKDTAGKLFAGYRISPVFSVEAHYTNLGSQRIDNTFDVPYGATGRGAVGTRREVHGFGADLLAGAEVAPRLWLFGKLGAFRAKVTTDTTISGDTSFADGTPGSFRSVEGRETVLKVGIGAEYAFNPKLGVRLEWERLPDLGKRLSPGASNATGEATMDALWVAVNWRF